MLFANFATALAEARGKAQAESLRRTRRDTPAYSPASRTATIEEIIFDGTCRPGDHVVVEAGQVIPGDGEIIEGVASVDESAITGESAPVIREAGGDRSGVTGGTTVLSDRIVVRITAGAGESFLDRMIALVEGAIRQRTPNEIALTLVLAAFTLIFLIVVVPLWPMAWNAEQYMMGYLGIAEPLKSLGTDVPTLVALLVCLIPTTIGALLAAIGIAGMDRALQANIIAKSGKAVEVGRRRRHVAAGQDRHDHDRQPPRDAVRSRRRLHAHGKLASLAALASVADETPEGKSIVELYHDKFSRRSAARRPSRCPPSARVRCVHRPDAHERHRSGRTAAHPQGRCRTPSLSYVQEQGGKCSARPATSKSTRSPPAAPRRSWSATGTEIAGVDRAGRHSEAGHPRAVRAAAPDGAADRDDHRRQPADGRGDRRSRPASTTSLPRPRRKPSSPTSARSRPTASSSP